MGEALTVKDFPLCLCLACGFNRSPIMAGNPMPCLRAVKAAIRDLKATGVAVVSGYDHQAWIREVASARCKSRQGVELASVCLMTAAKLKQTTKKVLNAVANIEVETKCKATIRTKVT